MCRLIVWMIQALFRPEPLESTAIVPRIALYHRFNEAGDFTAFVRSRGRIVQQISLHVASSNAPHQVNIDVAEASGEKPDCPCGPTDGTTTVLKGGVVGFFSSKGSLPYTVYVQRAGPDPNVVFNHEEGMPAGDLISTMLLLPGDYAALETNTSSRLPITVVRAPARPGNPRQLEPVIVGIGENGFSQDNLRIAAGQTIVFACGVPVRVRVQRLLDPVPPGPAT